MTNFVGKILRKLSLNNCKFSSLSYKLGYDQKLNGVLSSIYHMDMETLKDERLTKLKTRYNGRIKKRKWEENRRNDDTSEEKRVCTEPFERIKRKKVAMLFAYSGVKYFGMQRNPGMKTIEEDLLKALLASKSITDDAFAQIQTIQFQRAARTDKGVSAAMQVVSLKLPDLVDVVEINSHLPPEIRVFSIKRVTKGFNSKAQCDARTYIYMMPTYAFEHHDKIIENHSEYRVTPETMAKVNNVLKKFEGTKNFHNFTSRREFIDPSSRRYIISFQCEEPFVVDRLEFVTVKVKGQSFMMHQIRKMIGLSLAVIRGLTAEETIDRCWTSDRLDVPTAPGLGLVLDQIHYDRYNKRYGTDGIHDPLTWSDVQAELAEFKEKFIYPNIVSIEKQELSMAVWLEILPRHAYDVRDEDKKLEDDEENDDSDNESEVLESRKNEKKKPADKTEDINEKEISESPKDSPS